MMGLWGAWAAVWLLLGIGGAEATAQRDRIANADISQGASVIGAGLMLTPSREPAHPLATALVAALLVLALTARLSLGGSWSADVRAPVNGAAVRAGAYGVMRHPIYAAVGAAALVTALATRSKLHAAGAALLIGGLTVKARAEDRALGRDALDAVVSGDVVAAILPHEGGRLRVWKRD